MKPAGNLLVNIIPTDAEGKIPSPLEDKIETPEDMVGERLDFKITVKEAKGLPDERCRDPFITYAFYTDPR